MSLHPSLILQEVHPSFLPWFSVLFCFVFNLYYLSLLLCLSPHLVTVNSSRPSSISYSFLQPITEPLSSPVTIQFSTTSAQSRHLINIVESIYNDKTFIFGKLNFNSHYFLIYLIVALSKL